MRLAAALTEGGSRLDCRLASGGGHMAASFGEVVRVLDADAYIGPYEVTPDTSAQTLATAKKTMAQDVSVLAIPRHEVSNQSGTTFIIGGTDLYGL